MLTKKFIRRLVVAVTNWARATKLLIGNSDTLPALQAFDDITEHGGQRLFSTTIDSVSLILRLLFWCLLNSGTKGGGCVH